jgi:heme exporter protein B
MRSSWGTEIAAVLRKELLAELRTRSGLYTSGLFSVLAVVTIAFGTQTFRLEGSLAAGLIWVTLLFAAIVALPRTVLAEEEQGTGDLLRMLARPHAVFWGKALFNLFQMLLTALVLSLLFSVLANVPIRAPALYLFGLAGGCLALAGAVTLCGALVAQASNRYALAGAIALPLLLPLVALGVAASRASFGEGTLAMSWQSAIALWLYALAAFAGGPYLFASVWKN